MHPHLTPHVYRTVPSLSATTSTTAFIRRDTHAVPRGTEDADTQLIHPGSGTAKYQGTRKPQSSNATWPVRARPPPSLPGTAQSKAHPAACARGPGHAALSSPDAVVSRRTGRRRRHAALAVAAAGTSRSAAPARVRHARQLRKPLRSSLANWSAVVGTGDAAPIGEGTRVQTHTARGAPVLWGCVARRVSSPSRLRLHSCPRLPLRPQYSPSLCAACSADARGVHDGPGTKLSVVTTLRDTIEVV